MEKEFKSYKKTICHCNKISVFLHELAQSLSVIHAYVNGCNERLKENALDNKQLFEALRTVNKQTEIMATKIHCFNLNKLLLVDK